MSYSNRSIVEREVESILNRSSADRRRLVDELSALVLKAFEEGEDEGKRRERRRQRERG